MPGALRLVPPSKPARAKSPGPALQCPRCGGREVVAIRSGVVRDKNGRLRGGAEAAACFACLLKGERVLL